MSEQGRSIRLAVVDTDSAFVTVLQNRLDTAGWQHRTLSDAVPIDELIAMKLNAVIVDLWALGPRGWEFLERVASSVPTLGILVCTSKSTVAQRVRALRLGADDWITKPCHPEEVMARVEAVVRRRRRAEMRLNAWPVLHAELEIRADQFQAFVGGESLALTRREFELLQLLAEVPDQVIEREEIYQKVWGYAMAHGDRSVDVFVRKLRQKLQAASPHWRYIHTHFGVGYRFDPEPLEGATETEAPRTVTEKEPADAPESPPVHTAFT